MNQYSSTVVEGCLSCLDSVCPRGPFVLGTKPVLTLALLVWIVSIMDALCVSNNGRTLCLLIVTSLLCFAAYNFPFSSNFVLMCVAKPPRHLWIDVVRIFDPLAEFSYVSQFSQIVE